MSLVDEEGLIRTLLRANELRHQSRSEEGCVEAVLASLYSPSCRLAVYGTLAPGKPNQHILAGVPGEWKKGYVRGRLDQTGWGAEMGYPALRWMAKGPKVAVDLFVSEGLVEMWDQLDAFEGPEYQRILVTVYDEEDELMAVANLYEAR